MKVDMSSTKADDSSLQIPQAASLTFTFNTEDGNMHIKSVEGTRACQSITSSILFFLKLQTMSCWLQAKKRDGLKLFKYNNKNSPECIFFHTGVTTGMNAAIKGGKTIMYGQLHPIRNVLRSAVTTPLSGDEYRWLQLLQGGDFNRPKVLQEISRQRSLMMIYSAMSVDDIGATREALSANTTPRKQYAVGATGSRLMSI